MICPRFQLISAKDFNNYLHEFFLELLAYHHIDKDLDDPAPDRLDAWHMVVPVEGSRPFALTYKRGLSTMGRREVSRLYIDRVIPHRDDSPTVPPALYGFTDGARLVFFSADPARNRDDRFDLSQETWQFHTTQEKFERLHKDRLEFQTRLGRKRPLVEFLFEGSPLSADERFKRYVQFVRTELMRAVLADEQALASVLYWLLETPEAREKDKTRFVTADRHLKKSLEELHLEVGMRLGDAVAGAVDTLLLRYVMIRFLESYHPEAMEGLLKSTEFLQRGQGGRKAAPPRGSNGDTGQFSSFGSGAVTTATFTDTELELASQLTEPLGIDVSKAKKKAKGKDELTGDLFVFEDEGTFAKTILSEEEKRATRLGGDFYLADLGCAARVIEEVLLADPKSKGAKLLQDFLGRTGAPERAHWDFRYEDLRPQTLQDYYESSLGMAVQLSFSERTKEFSIDVGKSKRQHKELGAYYTDSHLCRFMVECTVKPLFEERIGQLRQSIVAKDQQGAQAALDVILGMAICDPTMGSAPFLRSAFDYLSEQYLPLCRTIAEAKDKLPGFYHTAAKHLPFLAGKGGRMDDEGVGRFEWHILRRMLYGVDIDLKAVCIACQTFALSALKYLQQGERFPSFFNLNLKLGNALVSPIRPEDRAKLAEQHGQVIARLIQLRREAMTLPNTEGAYARLAALQQEIDGMKTPIIRDLVQEYVAPILQEFTEDLRPFCWELEFPEVFFTLDGGLRQDAGFDVIIGNSPWEAFRPRDKEFFDALEPGFRYETKTKRDNQKEHLLKNISIAANYGRYCAQIEAQRRFVIDSGLYRGQFPVVLGKRQTSDVNMFKCILERTLDLTKTTKGWFCLILQSGVTRDIGSRDLRLECLRSGRIVGIWEFRNKTDGDLIFPRVDPNQRFVLFAVARGESSTTIPYRYCRSFADLSEFEPDEKGVSVEIVKRVSGEAFEFQTFEDPLLLRVLEKLYAYPRLDDGERRYLTAIMRRELDTDKHERLFRSHDTGVPLWEGSLVQHYTISPASKRWVDPHEFGPLAEYSSYSRVVIRRILPNSARRIYAGLVPPGVALSDSLSYFVPTQPLAQKLFILAFLNSLIVEHRLLQSITGITLSHYRIGALPIPDWPENNPAHQEIVRAVASIIIINKRFQNELYLTGFNVEEAEDIQKTKDLIDALVARAYGLTKAEFEIIVNTFEKLKDIKRKSVLDIFESFGGNA